jgi:hypothetical protein
MIQAVSCEGDGIQLAKNSPHFMKPEVLYPVQNIPPVNSQKSVFVRNSLC